MPKKPRKGARASNAPASTFTATQGYVQPAWKLNAAEAKLFETLTHDWPQEWFKVSSAPLLTVYVQLLIRFRDLYKAEKYDEGSSMAPKIAAVAGKLRLTPASQAVGAVAGTAGKKASSAADKPAKSPGKKADVVNLLGGGAWAEPLPK